MEKPFMVKAVQAHKEKNELKFKKGQLITVEKINEEGTHYHGFYGKKQGWFPIHYAAIADGSDPVLRKKDDGSTETDKKKRKEEKKKVEMEKREATVRAKREAKEALKEERRKRPVSKKASAKSRPALSPDQFDRGDLPTHSFRGKIPTIIDETVTYLEQDERLMTEGLFRISGSVSEVKALKAAYLRGERVDLDKVTDTHAVAGVLKLFFREARDPLLTYELYPCWLAVMDEDDHIQAIRRVIDLLPMINKLILYRLMGLLNRVTLFVDANKMTPNNVAIVFAPNILRPPNEDVAMVLRGCAAGNHLVRCMIEDYDIIFGEGQVTASSTRESKRSANRVMKTEEGAKPTEPEQAAIESDVLRPEADAAPPSQPTRTKTVEGEEDFNRKMRMGSLLLAKGSMVGSQNSFERLARAGSDTSEVVDDQQQQPNDLQNELDVAVAPSPGPFTLSPRSSVWAASSSQTAGGAASPTKTSVSILGSSHRMDRSPTPQVATRPPYRPTPPPKPVTMMAAEPDDVLPVVDDDDEDDEEDDEDDDDDQDDDDDEEDEEEEPPVKALAMDELMEMILDGKSSEVAAYLATLAPDVAARTQKDLLFSIDKIMQSIS